ncbi:hypothetical protein AK812_SmicGene28123 [Symbiodinium microadriaticum]|uniref:Uncharacterized protein n=1 Tax=Symbiodinium microadriaticum TaxID=2951 RepID=A0A1Q9D544_SYMMI|nr:hypothetical protein AK812_SmicGene28123 [Symbiodinium microadriaticum]
MSWRKHPIVDPLGDALPAADANPTVPSVVQDVPDALLDPPADFARQLPDRQAIFAYLEGTYSSPTRNIPERIVKAWRKEQTKEASTWAAGSDGRRLQEGGRKGVLGCDGNGSGPARNPGGKGQGQHRPSCGDLLPAAKLDADKAASPTAPGLT